MRTEQRIWKESTSWESNNTLLGQSASLVLAFGATRILKQGQFMSDLQASYPNAHICGCSTAGEIYDTIVLDDCLVCTAVEFSKTRLQAVQIQISSVEDSYITGKKLARSFAPEGLVHLMVFSNGLLINGSELVKGLNQHLPEEVTLSGGLAADGEDFQETLVFLDGAVSNNSVIGLGFYGGHLRVGCGSEGGWHPFGPERLITRSQANVLYEMDGRSALELYKQYLGKYADGLPSTALLFPLCIREQDRTELVRTVLSVDEAQQRMIFAGDVPEGAYAFLMRTNTERLIDGAGGAAQKSQQTLGNVSSELAIIISCVGRRMVLRQRTEEELEVMRETLGSRPVLTGFYSYGEIGPQHPGGKVSLHNQTMTITTFAEE